MKIKRMKKIFRMSQEELFHYLIGELRRFGYNDMVMNYGDSVSFRGGYIYALGQEEVMVVAHLDTVHATRPELILYDPQLNIMSSPQGIGADDRAGVIAILDLLAMGVRPHVLFTKDEEIGGIGATSFANDCRLNEVIFACASEVKHIIEIDRRGGNDAVFYECGNKDYQDYILSFGFDDDWGTFSDICTISPLLDIASVNISAGYYNEHTKYEYLNINELRNNTERIYDIILDAENVGDFDYQESYGTWWNKYNSNKAYNGYGKYGDYDDYNDLEDYGGYLSEKEYMEYEDKYYNSVSNNNGKKYNKAEKKPMTAQEIEEYIAEILGEKEEEEGDKTNVQ